MRTAILRQRGEELGVALPADLIEYVAHRDQTNIRELEGALNKVIAYAEINNRALTVDVAMEAITDTVSGARRTKSTPESVLGAVASHFNAEIVEMRGRSRSRSIVLPRQVAMYLLREETGASLVDIGQTLGGRDHTTVMHGIEKIERELQTDTQLRSHVMRIREAILSGSYR
jgi:chromosomal replication initiator protein